MTDLKGQSFTLAKVMLQAVLNISWKKYLTKQSVAVFLQSLMPLEREIQFTRDSREQSHLREIFINGYRCFHAGFSNAMQNCER